MADRIGRGVALFVFLLLASQSLRAQGNTGSLTGTTVDEQRLRLPNVALTLQDTQTGLKRTQASSPDGAFEFTALPPGEYKITANAEGFQPLELRLTLEVNQQAKLDVILSVASQSETIQVAETIPLLHPNEAAVGEVVDHEHVAQLPLNGRQFMELAMLVPGVHSSHGASMGNMSALYWRPGQSSAISVSGGRPNSNTYLLDGTVNTDPAFNTYVISLSPDAIREFQIETGTYTAELGGAGTGQVNVVTKSGTNSLHGSAYEYLRNSAMDARDFTSPSQLPHFAHNQFGATAGGPVWKDHTFFFAAYEGFRMVQGQSNIMSVPTAAARLGNFTGVANIYDPNLTQPNPAFDPARPVSSTNPQSLRPQFANNTIPGDRINPIARTVLNQFVPLPNLPGESNNYLDTRAQRLSNDQGDLRIDHVLANGTSLFGRYSVSAERGFTPENLPGFGSFHDNRVQNLTLTDISPWSSHLVGEFRGGVSRMVLHRYAENANGPDYIRILGITGAGFGGPEANGLPQFNVQGYQPFGDSLLCTPCAYGDTVIQGGGKLTWVHGNNSLRFGGDVERFRWNMKGFFQNRGYFQFSPGFTSRTLTNDGTGNALANFLLGFPVLQQVQNGIPSMQMRQTYLDLFVQDDWRATAHLTVNLGLRYELRTPLHDIGKILTNLTWQNGVPSAYVGGQNGFPESLAFGDHNNYAPRIGIAYSPGAGKWVFRAGYGMFYSYPDMNLWCNQVHDVPLVFPQAVQSDNFTPSISGFAFPANPVLGVQRVSFTALDPHGKTPYVQQASVTIEKKLTESMMLQLGYVGAWAKKLDRARLPNNAPPGSAAVQPRRPVQNISFLPGTQLPSYVPVASLTFPVSAVNLLENSASSSYNSAFVLVKKRFSHGLSFLANYTFSKSLTDAPDFRSPANEAEVPQNSYNLRAEWGLSGCDIPHRFVTSVIYKMPFSSHGLDWKSASGFAKLLAADWQVSTIYQWQSGFPFTVSVFGDTANAGSLLNVNPVRADVVPGVSPYLPSDKRSGDMWFNTDAFVTPAAFAFGNAGRNTVRGPRLSKADLSLERKFALREQTLLGFRAEFFNLFNHTNFDTPNRFVNTPQFGSVTMAATSSRQVQFALRLEF